MLHTSNKCFSAWEDGKKSSLGLIEGENTCWQGAYTYERETSVRLRRRAIPSALHDCGRKIEELNLEGPQLNHEKSLICSKVDILKGLETSVFPQAQERGRSSG